MKRQTIKTYYLLFYQVIRKIAIPEPETGRFPFLCVIAEKKLDLTNFLLVNKGYIQKPESQHEHKNIW